MEQKIEMVQKQQLIFTQDLQQGVYILQLAIPQLIEQIENEILENPVLELEPEEVVEEPKQKEEDPEIDWEKYLEQKDDYFPTVGAFSGLEAEPNYENLVTREPSLREHLLWQLRVLTLTKEEFRIGRFLIGEIDKNGYLSLPLESLADSLKIDLSGLEKMLAEIQTFDPAGVGARSLMECLEIQAKELGWDNTPIIILIRNHLEDVHHRRYGKIAKKMGISLSKIKGLVKDLSTLEPKPGRLYENKTIFYVIPDVIVSKVDNKFIVSLNKSRTPKLRIGSYYREVLKQCNSEHEVAEYIQERLKSASWFIKCVEQRESTIMRVATAIFDIQDEFLRIGPPGLKTLKLKDIALRVELNPTTVSRAIANKYAQTSWGMFALKYFFKSGVDTEKGGEASSTQVKDRIKTLIENEDTTHPLSDSKIMELLRKEEGINAARRTVSKYREELQIRSSHMRREK